MTAGLLMLGKAAMALYLMRAADSSAYGIAGTTLVVILFLAYSAQIFLLGAKFTAVWIDDFGHGMTPRRGWMRVQRRAHALLDSAPADDSENPPTAAEPPHPVEASMPEDEGSVGPDHASQPPS